MTLIARLAPAARLIDAAADRARAALPLVVRVVLGHGFLLTGYGKWTHFDATARFFASLGIPAPTANAAFVATLELVGGAALIVGLFARPFAALLASTVVVALATADLGKFKASWTPSGEAAPLEVSAFVFLLLSAVVFALGAGPLSIDARRAGRSKAAAAAGAQSRLRAVAV